MNWFCRRFPPDQSMLWVNPRYQELLKTVPFQRMRGLYEGSPGERIKEMAARSVFRVRLAGAEGPRDFYLKRHRREFIGPWALFCFRSPERCRAAGPLEFQTMREFRQAGIATAPPAMAGVRHFRWLWAESFLLTENFDPFISLEALFQNAPDFFEGHPERKRRLLAAIARLARKMHQAGFNHRDFNATHLLVHYRTEDGPPKLALFDLQRVDRLRLLSFRWPVKSLARMMYSLPAALFSPGDKQALFRFYKNKKELGPLDRLQWRWIQGKIARIARHTEKMMARRAARRKKGLPER